jgi:hypothetical protein
MKTILTQRQLRKLDELKEIDVHFLAPPHLYASFLTRPDWARVSIDAKDLFIEYAPTLSGTGIKNISTRLRDYYDYIQYYNKGIGGVVVRDDLLREYETHLKNDLHNGQGNVWVKMSHIRAIFKWYCDNKKVDSSWWLEYKVRGKPFQKKEKALL